MDRRTFNQLADALNIPTAVRMRSAPPTAAEHESQKFLSENLIAPDAERKLFSCRFASLENQVVIFKADGHGEIDKIPILAPEWTGWQSGTNGPLQIRGQMRVAGKTEGLAFATLYGSDGLRNYSVFPFEVTA